MNPVLLNSSLIRWIDDQLAELPEKYQALPPNLPPLEEGEVVIGKASETAVAFYGLSARIDDQISALGREHTATILGELGNVVQQTGRDSELEARIRELEQQTNEKGGQITALRAQSSFFMELFWAQIRNELGYWKGDIGLRQGGQVVEMPKKKSGLDL
ncbi:MAG: hypothetical protein KGZ30_02405, partial [Anaplasmataceae bacterium]|nr:hypothetical protein [Anaplasmataceae bacterium]